LKNIEYANYELSFLQVPLCDLTDYLRRLNRVPWKFLLKKQSKWEMG